MVPDKFNMVDMGGIDLIMMQGETVPDLYQRLVESIAQCRYQCLYNWLFDGVQIPPTYVQLEIDEDTGDVCINEGVSVTEDDIIHIYSIENAGILVSLSVTENGTYLPEEGVDGFSEVSVSVPAPTLEEISVTENGVYTPTEYGFSKVTVNVSTPVPPVGESWLDFLVTAVYSDYVDPLVTTIFYVTTDLSWEGSAYTV